MNQKREFIVFGHRGAKGYEPENTIASFKKAVELGVKWIEFDVWNVEDKQIVIHDHRLERLTNGTGFVPSLTFDYLRSLDAGKGQKLPTFQETMEYLMGKVSINIELKGPGTAERCMQLVSKYLRDGKLTYDQLVISSFNHLELSIIKKLDPKIKIGALLVGLPLGITEFATKLGAFSVNQSVEYAIPEFINDAHSRTLKVFVYTVNLDDDVRRMIEWGADGVFSDFPDRALAVAKELGIG